MSKLDTITLFPRAADGCVDLKNSNYQDIVPINIKIKYEKEIFFAFGTAMVMTNKGRVEGCQCREFEYTSKTVISKKDRNQDIKEKSIMIKF